MTKDAMTKGQSLLARISQLITERDNAIRQHAASTTSLDPTTAAGIQGSLTAGYNALLTAAQAEFDTLSSDFKNT
jgi:hypothetical protein